MILFIDLTNQITEGEKEFAFFDSATGNFLNIADSQVWVNIDDFADDCKIDNKTEYIRRCSRLIPENFFD